MLYSLLFAQCCTRACFKIKKCTKHLFYSLIYGKMKKKGTDIMLRCYELTDQEWEQVASLLPPEKTGKAGRPSKDNRIMLNGMVWIARSGAPWRDLPERYGPWNSVYNRFRNRPGAPAQCRCKKGGLQTKLATAGDVPVPKSMQP